ncbi:MAG: ABC transporter substrate-binding protein [Rhizobiaceae bacterium]|nr:ABC transporter substrate-binding protein [Rhizobiaceae bacterium]
MKSLAIAVSLACVSSLAAVSTASAETKVRINQAFQSVLYLPIYIAKEKGFFADQGVDVDISTGGGGSQSWAAVISGSADFSIQDPLFVPKTRENGGDGVVVAGVHNAPTVFIIGKDPTPLQDNLKYLSGKRVITSPQPDTTWAFMTYLSLQEKIDDVKIVNVAIGNEIPAIVSGAADYALAVETQVSQAVKEQGLHVVYSFSANKDWFPFAFSSLTTTNDYIQKNPEAAQGVVTAFELASRYIYADLEGSVDVAQKYFPDIPRDILKQAIQRNIDAKGYPEHVLVEKKAWDNNLNIAVYAGNIGGYPTEATSYENNVNVELAKKAAEIADAKK